MLENLTDRLSPDHLRARLQRARTDVSVARVHGTVRLWSLGTEGLERAHDLLAHAPGPLVAPLKRAVDSGLDHATRLPVAGYDGMNVKQVDEAVRGLGPVDLARVERYERAHKDRKTVHRAVERERARFEHPAADA